MFYVQIKDIKGHWNTHRKGFSNLCGAMDTLGKYLQLMKISEGIEAARIRGSDKKVYMMVGKN